MKLTPIGYMKSDFPTKFGLPRQSGLIEELVSYVVMEKDYAVPEAFRGIDGYSHLFLIWGFSLRGTDDRSWSPTVRPPRLGGNKRMGVFATRSPNRPNPLGLSCVKLLGITEIDGRIALAVGGADLADGTPIYDIKPYLPFADAHPEAKGGFSEEVVDDRLTVKVENTLLEKLPISKREALIKLLKADPRPSYHHDETRIYGFTYAGYEIKFRVFEDVLTVTDVIEEKL